MCRFYLGKFPDAKIPQWRVNDDILEHHFGNIRGYGRGDTHPMIGACCAATRRATIFRILGPKRGNSGAAPRGDEEEEDYRSFAAPTGDDGLTTQERIFTHDLLS